MTAAAAKSKDPQSFNILTDLAPAPEWRARLNDAAQDMPALGQLIDMLTTRQVSGADNTPIALGEDALTLAQAELLFYLVTETKPILSVETGFYYGLAAGVITAAHLINGLNGGHIPIQENARTQLEGVGVQILEKLSLTGYQIMEHEPALVLPQIYLQKLNDGLKLVYFNSADNIEEQMMEYFYVNHLLNEGGIMAVNTASPARQELVAFIRRHRHDYLVRELECGITLVQKPWLSDLTQTSGMRH